MAESAEHSAPGWKVWVEAARPRTLPASIVPVLVGTAASRLHLQSWLHGVRWDRMALAMVVAVSLQVAVNFANDWFDGVGGVDTADRVGPRRVTAAGLVTPRQIRMATFLALAVAGLAGLVLALQVEPWLLLVGLAAGLAALGYSGGRRPYASAGLGEVFVFVFFGLVATLGSQYVQYQRLSRAGVFAACAVGLWSVALLLVNNLRDIPTDTATGKRTLAVRIGSDATRGAYLACILVAHVLVVAIMLTVDSTWPALALVALLPAAPAMRAVRGGVEGPALIGALGQTARAQLVFGLLLTIGLWQVRPPGFGG